MIKKTLFHMFWDKYLNSNIEYIEKYINIKYLDKYDLYSIDFHNNPKMLDSLLGPLGPEYCYYFYILMVISLVVLAAAVVGVIRRLLTDKKAEIITLLVLLVQPSALWYAFWFL